MKNRKVYFVITLMLSLVLSGCTATESVFDGGSVTVNQSELNLSTSDGEYKITKAGTYELTGDMTGMVVVDADGAKVEIVLNNVNLSNPNNAVIYVKDAKKVTISTTAGSVNTISCDAFENLDDNTIDGVIFCKSDLTLEGEGTLIVNGTSLEGHGIVCKDELKIKSGTYEINAKKTAIQANDYVGIEGGEITINAGTKGIHCDGVLDVLDGNITVLGSTEGFEALKINISGGHTDITASDDGLNATNGSGMDDGMNFGRGGFGQQDAGVVSDVIDSDMQINISGGYLHVNAQGDGIDSNGTFNMTGGEVYVSGPTNNGNGALDFGRSGSISGGTIIAVGSSGMAETLESDSQGVIQLNVAGAEGDKVIVTDTAGKEIVSWIAEKQFENIVISSPEFKENGTYNVQVADMVMEITLEGHSYSEGGNRFGGPGGFGGHDGGNRQEGFGRPEGFDKQEDLGGLNEFGRPDDFVGPGGSKRRQ